MIYFLYYIITFFMLPFFLGWAILRTILEKEDKHRLQERFGQSSCPRPSGRVLWFHAASIGEALTFLPFINYYHRLFPHMHFLITTGTKASALLIEKQLPSRCFHQYVALDHPLFVLRFLNHWKPNIGFWVESDFWPNLIKISSQRLPLFLLNGRLSFSSFNRWKFLKNTFKSLMESFEIIFPQTHQDQKHFSFFGLENLEYAGNLKFSGKLLSFEEKDASSLKKATSNRPVWVASNTHAGEEKIILNVYEKLKKTHKDLLLILIPRHIQRDKEIIEEIKSRGFNFKVRDGAKKLPTNSTDIYVANTLGETGLFYHNYPLIFMGGSLLPHIGGHNILEPARFGCTIIFGLYMDNNKDMADLLIKNKVSFQVDNEKSLYNTISSMLEKKKVDRPYAKALEALLCNENGFNQRLKKISPYLKRINNERT